jgi:hypothetical protein
VKVIQTDNFDRDWIPDKLIADGLTENQAVYLAAEKNAAASPYGDAFFRAVPDDYKLSEGDR